VEAINVDILQVITISVVCYDLCPSIIQFFHKIVSMRNQGCPIAARSWWGFKVEWIYMLDALGLIMKSLYWLHDALRKLRVVFSTALDFIRIVLLLCPMILQCSVSLWAPPMLILYLHIFYMVVFFLCDYLDTFPSTCFIFCKLMLLYIIEFLFLCVYVNDLKLCSVLSMVSYAFHVPLGKVFDWGCKSWYYA